VKRVLIVGDSCKDVFIYGDIKRLTPEAPVPVFNPLREIQNYGMAKNVANNVEALDTSIYTITNPNSIKKVRYVDNKSNQMVLRVDEHDYCERIDSVLLSTIQDNKCIIWGSGETEVDAIIVSDYCKGFLTEDDIKWICDNNKNVFVDTKKKLDEWINNVTYLKINSLEYENNEEFLNEYYSIMDKTIVTKGNEGCLFKNKIYPTEDVQVKDISGAGDTFLAGLVVEYLNSNDIEKAIKFAQDCTKIVVQKHGVSTV
tara:strand:+ start:929 stop:1699 length:771 start_codon:yes stop_codon:yes gene_type:complete